MSSAHLDSLGTSTEVTWKKDSSVRELEGVHVRILHKGIPRNIFTGVEELPNATAPGHYTAIKKALQKADLLDWKERLVGFGSDGAAVMVGRHGGVAQLLMQDVPHLNNIHCLGQWFSNGGTSASADMICRTKQCLLVLKDYEQLSFMVLVQDILSILSCLSLKLQEDGLTLPQALQAFEVAVLRIVSVQTTTGEKLELFLDHTKDEGTVPGSAAFQFQ
ncbi:hypothetical protein QQF64_021825 [Cirrhinus molitorella]|uniref:DUF4371 domain-containing protein n=1 Tax=Cirrhinus molitorella TaxID=172907 RepID=A0ABR3L6L1_9TELE